MIPVRIPNTYYWSFGAPNCETLMFAFRVGRCDECGAYTHLDEYMSCVFGGTYYEQPEFDYMLACNDCAARYRLEEQREQEAYEAWAEEEHEYP